jgi:hypothetical protein
MLTEDAKEVQIEETLSSYLLFGILGLNMAKIVQNPSFNKSLLNRNLFNVKKANKEDAESFSSSASSSLSLPIKLTADSTSKSLNESDLDNFLLELTNETSMKELSFSSVLSEFFLLCNKIDKPMVLLHIIVSIV